MYYTLTIPTNDYRDGDMIYSALIIDADNKIDAWRKCIKHHHINNEDIQVDKTADLCIDGVYMVELTPQQFRNAILSGEYGGLKTIEVY